MKKAKDIMGQNLTSVNEDAQLKDVAELLSRSSLSRVPVVNKRNEVVGSISEKDIIVSVFPERVKIENPEVISLERLSPLIKKLCRNGAAMVKDYMSETLYYVTEDTPLGDVAELMLKKTLSGFQ